MKTCARCLQEYPIAEFSKHSHYAYCDFCYHHKNRIWGAFARAGKRGQLRQLHRPYYHWRTSPALDREYLEQELEAAA